MMRPSTAAVALLGAGSVANAAIAKTCPVTDICYSLNIPDTTAQSGKGDIYFQISAPTTYSWVALGQGSGMAGANIFVVYSSANGQNVTLSPRLGKGHVMPQHSTNANVTLLAGSGISNGMMTANVKCSNCDSWSGGTMDFTSSSNAAWIYAHKSGSPLDSDDVAEGISQHDDGEPFSFNLAIAKGGSDVNPFVASAATASPSGTSSSAPATVTQDPASAPLDAETLKNIKVRSAHAYTASTAFLIVFPLGAILIRLGNFTGLVWVHAAVQMLGYVMFIAVVGMGAYLATYYDEIMNAHPIIGLVVFALMSLQPISGLAHHIMFKKQGRRTLPSWAHLTVGRVAVVLGIANGFIGLSWADDAPQSDRHAYLALAVISLVVYIGSIIYGEYTKAKKIRRGPNPSSSRSSHSGEDVAKVEMTAEGKSVPGNL